MPINEGFLFDASVEEIVIIIIVIIALLTTSIPALLTTFIPALVSTFFRQGIYISISQPIKKDIRSKLFVFVACKISLCSINLGEA